MSRSHASLPGVTTPIRSPTVRDDLDAAYAQHEYHLKGSITIGKRADFVVLDRNPAKVPTNEIRKIQILKTILAGREVYRLGNRRGFKV